MALLPVATEEKRTCHGLQLELQTHKDNQQFMDPETGECTKLLVQAVKLAPKTNQVKVTDSIRKIPKLSISLFRSPPQSVAEALLWPLKFLLCSI